MLKTIRTNEIKPAEVFARVGDIESTSKKTKICKDARKT